MEMESGEGHKFDTESSLPNLSDKYQWIRYIASGRNDSAHLVQRADETQLVALSPSQYGNVEWNWQKTTHKTDKANILDQMGLQKHVVHELDRGLLPLKNSNQPERVVIVDYAGEPITTVQSDSDRIEILKQIWKVTETIHVNQHAINDFKQDHWLFSRDEQGNVQVKLIDYTQIARTPIETGNDHRTKDLLDYDSVMRELLPWFNYKSLIGISFDQMQERTRQALVRAEEESRTFSSRKKIQLRFLNSLRKKLGK